MNAQTPAALGYAMPAEWAPHRATWLSWPHKEASWPGKFHLIEPVYARMVAALARSEPVYINVADAALEQRARGFLAAAGAQGDIRFQRVPTNDAWCRDHGAIFVLNQGQLAATRWGYNAWGGKYPPFDLDVQIPGQMAQLLDVPLFDGGMILEGGSIEVNGAGLLLTSEACLLNPNRNPDLSRGEIEQRLREFLGVSQILWLGDGIVGDDTDGHVDDLARFVAERVVLTTVEADPQDENYHVLQENLQRLRLMRDQRGRPLEIISIPMPPPVVYEGQRLPATHANYYVANTVVLLPTYGGPSDAVAAAALARCFPGRAVIGIDCTDLIWGLGAFHCLTQQVPA